MNSLELYKRQNIDRIYKCSSITQVNFPEWSAMNVCLQHDLFSPFLSLYFSVTASQLVATDISVYC